MATFTLDSIRQEAEKRYGNMDITLSDGRVVTLLNALKLEKDVRKKLGNLQSDIEDEDGEEEDAEDMLADAIRLVSSDAELAEALLSEIGGDLTVLAQIFKTYSQETETGEASASQN